MKKITIYIVWFCAIVPCLAQNHSIPDTSLPKISPVDQVKSQPKLKGGALIDTINSKKYKNNFPVPDTIPKPSKPIKNQVR